jgi:hypothetical protein
MSSDVTTSKCYMYMGVRSDVTKNRCFKYVELLLCVWEVSTAFTGPQAGYPDGALLWFSSDFPANCWDSTSN